MIIKGSSYILFKTCEQDVVHNRNGSCKLESNDLLKYSVICSHSTMSIPGYVQCFSIPVRFFSTAILQARNS